MKHKTIIGAIAWIAIASSALAQVSNPFFEYTGGAPDSQQTVAGGNFIPAGARETDSMFVGGVPQAVTVVLRDPGFDGAARRVCVDYIGTDALAQNRFYVPGAIDWCNQASCANATATPLGLGGRSLAGPYTATACFQMNVGQPVPFIFDADVLNRGGNGTHTVGNGQANLNAHWGVFPYPFVFSTPIPTSSAVLVIGLADGGRGPAADDDHQDFAVRLTAQPGPSATTQIPTLGQWGLIFLALVMAALGSRFARRSSR